MLTCVGPFVPAQNGPICFVFLIPLAIYFFIINLSGAFLLHKWLRLLDATTGPDHSWFITLLSYCCSAQGFQVSPSRENAWDPCQSPVQRPHLLIPMVKVVFQVSEIGPGFESVYTRGRQISEAPLGAVFAADMELSLCGFDPTVIRTRDEEIGQRYQPSHYLLLSAASPREIVRSVPVTLWKVVSFPTYTTERLQVVSDFHLYSLIWILVICEEIKLKMHMESWLLRILSYS